MTANAMVDRLLSKLGSRKVVLFAIFYYLFSAGLIEAASLTAVGIATLVALGIEDGCKALAGGNVEAAKIQNTLTIKRDGGNDEPVT
jgi:hypothetical protein